MTPSDIILGINTYYFKQVNLNNSNTVSGNQVTSILKSSPDCDCACESESNLNPDCPQISE